MLVILMVTEMMMLMMAMTMSMEFMMLDGPICQNALQILDMTAPKPRFGRSPDQLLLQSQWKVARPTLRSERENTHHLA